MFDQILTVSEASSVLNETLKAALPALIIEGEVSGFNVNRGKFVFFDLKDNESILPCFMMAFALKFPIEDGMKVKVLVEPGITAKGRFSLTVRELQPVGEGSLKKAFEIMKAKLATEGLFDPERKRQLPKYPSHIAVVSSSGAAGWADFSKIISARWGGLNIQLTDVAVQGLNSPNEVVGAIEYFNAQASLADVLVVIRGGGSADDLAAFSNEAVVRAIASSRIPTIVGVGHETDESLAELAADVTASTPSNAAELVVPDKNEVIRRLDDGQKQVEVSLRRMIDGFVEVVEGSKKDFKNKVQAYINDLSQSLTSHNRLIEQLNPSAVLRRGYAILRSGTKIITSVKNVKIGDRATIEIKDGKLGVTIDGTS